MPKVRSLATGNELPDFEAVKKFRENPNVPDTYKAMDDDNLIRSIARDYADEYEIVDDPPPTRKPTNRFAYPMEEMVSDLQQGKPIAATGKAAANVATSIGNQVYGMITAIPNLAGFLHDKNMARQQLDLAIKTRQQMDPSDPNYEAVVAREDEMRSKAAMPTMEEAWEALSDDYKQRYGSFEGFAKAIVEDPAAVAADVATVATGVGAVARGLQLASKASRAGRIGGALDRTARAANRVASAVDPINVAGRGARAMIPGKQPLSEMMYRAGLSLKLNDPERLDSVIRTGLDAGITTNLKDETFPLNRLRQFLGDELKKSNKERLQQQLDNWSNKYQQAVDNATQQGKMIDMRDLVDDIRAQIVDMRQTLTGDTEAEVIRKGLDKWLVNNNIVAKDAQGNPIIKNGDFVFQAITPDQANNFRREFTKKLQNALTRKSRSSPNAPWELRSATLGDEMLRQSLLNNLRKIDPDLAEVGDKMRDFIDLEKAAKGLLIQNPGGADRRVIYPAVAAAKGANLVWNTTALATEVLKLPGVLTQLAVDLNRKGIRPNTRLQNLIRQAGYNTARFSQAVEKGEFENLEKLDRGESLPTRGKFKVRLPVEQNPYVDSAPPERNPYR